MHPARLLRLLLLLYGFIRVLHLRDNKSIDHRRFHRLSILQQLLLMLHSTEAVVDIALYFFDLNHRSLEEAFVDLDLRLHQLILQIVNRINGVQVVHHGLLRVKNLPFLAGLLLERRQLFL